MLTGSMMIMYLSPIMFQQYYTPTQHISFQPPNQHVYYLKTHKTGSTTMLSIFAEYCRSHDLLPLLPRGKHISQEGPFDDRSLLLQPGVTVYDMVFNHHIYSPRVLTYLHDDTISITILREPFDNFKSAFRYYRVVFPTYLQKVKGEDPFMEFLENFNRYEVGGYKTHTLNRQSVDLGYNISMGYQNISYITSFIKATEKRFNLVMITEFFDEGLVLMKRLLNWRIQDILYLHKNIGPPMKGGDNETASVHIPKLEQRQRILHANFSRPDIELYKYFLEIFKKKIANEIGLHEEVIEFREIAEEFRKYCLNISKDKSSPILDIRAKKWTNGFRITPNKCELLVADEAYITEYMQKRQRMIFRRGKNV